MQLTAILISSVLAFASMSAAAPAKAPAAAKATTVDACFIVGKTALPQEVIDAANEIKGQIVCDNSTEVLPHVPDTESNGFKFSEINFSKSNLSTLAFSLKEFATPEDPIEGCLDEFENSLAVYIATEAAQRSLGASLAIKVPKFFLAFQVARIKTAQNITITNAGQTVQHLLGKVTKNAAGQDADLLAEVQKLATIV